MEASGQGLLGDRHCIERHCGLWFLRESLFLVGCLVASDAAKDLRKPSVCFQKNACETHGSYLRRTVAEPPLFPLASAAPRFSIAARSCLPRRFPHAPTQGRQGLEYRRCLGSREQQESPAVLGSARFVRLLGFVLRAGQRDRAADHHRARYVA